jgi:ATP-binding cassette, subfamily G (WHITE), member 2, SNQ2
VANFLQYLTPVPFAYENIMAAEFHNRLFPCQPESVIPAGAAYNEPQFQACASRGSTPGQLNINGNEYLQSEFGFAYSNVGRNYGILLVFTFGFLAINMWIVEHVDWVRSGGSLLEFAHGRRKKAKGHVRDEESVEGPRAMMEVPNQTSEHQTRKGLAQSGSTFSWRNLDYSVPHQHGEKQLLRDVSAYCSPGRLMALVGASGAGKSTRRSLPCLPSRTCKLTITSPHSPHPAGCWKGHGRDARR